MHESPSAVRRVSSVSLKMKDWVGSDALQGAIARLAVGNGGSESDAETVLFGHTEVGHWYVSFPRETSGSWLQ